MNKVIKKILFVVLVTIIISLLLFVPRLHYEIGNIFFGKSAILYNVDIAKFFYTRATSPVIGKVPKFSHYQLSRTYFITGFFNRSIEEAKKELLFYPENTRTYYILGLTYGYMNREEDAIEAFSKFIDAFPDSWAARNDKAWLQFRVGDINGALETIEPVSDVLNPWVQNTYGTILLNLGRRVEAERAFIKAGQNVKLFTPEMWGTAYPGNDPRIYQTGLNAIMGSIDNNLKLTQ